MKFSGDSSVKCLLATAAFGALLLSNSSGATELTVTVSDIKSDVGALNITLYNNPDDWLSDRVFATKQLRISESMVEGIITTSFEVEPGEYAVSVHHDNNDNGKMDTNFIGIPKEPLGLSNGAVPKYGPPKYKDAVFSVGADGASMPIKLLD
ncbi:DUF2141 domain-containing protein [Halieaceae bacterium IMCC14734]|uniref:DUF2141 domain-containing protein n=1 Tax=Candidatus Litorirhabdus singularis TaxID=2518993 RepID=A0ABT3TD25_9GAMM|nr:DUF2141 domain-containing protein [Candidatus Litorirhabdus singularis]MCX2980203.1 DUF2141 domain-containing protein [Candidatus Litorirhabdus singularis]